MKKRLGFLLALVATTAALTLCAQTPNNVKGNELKDDTTSFDHLMKIADSLFEINNARAVRYAKRAKILSLKEGDTARLVYASRLIGQLENRLGNIDSAIQQFTFILPIAERNECSDDVKKILNSLAVSYTYKNEFGKALEYHLRSLVLREQAQNRQEVSITLHNIASVFITSSNHEQALIYLAKCLKVKQEILDSLDLDRLYINLGICHTALGNYSEARAAYNRATSICEPNCILFTLIMTSYGIGDIYQAENNLPMAKRYFEKALMLSVQNDNLQMRLSSLMSLAQIAFEQKDMISLQKNLAAFESIAGKHQFPIQMLLFYDLSSKYHLSYGDYKGAFETQKRHSELAGSINSPRMNKKIMDMQLEFSERENFQKISAQQELLNAQNSSIEKQNVINLLLLGVAVLTVMLIIVLFKANQRKSHANKILDQLVRERTSELEQNRITLQQAYNEQSIVLERVGRDLISSLATIQGLNNLATLENFADSGTYLKATEATLFKSIEAIRSNKVSCRDSM